MKSKLVVLAALLASQAAFAQEYKCNVLEDTHGHSLSDASFSVITNGSEVILAEAPSTIEMVMKRVSQFPEGSVYKAGNAEVTIVHGTMVGEAGEESVNIQVGMYSAACFELEY